MDDVPYCSTYWPVLMYRTYCIVQYNRYEGSISRGKRWLRDSYLREAPHCAKQPSLLGFWESHPRIHPILSRLIPIPYSTTVESRTYGTVRVLQNRPVQDNTEVPSGGPGPAGVPGGQVRCVREGRYISRGGTARTARKAERMYERSSTDSWTYKYSTDMIPVSADETPYCTLPSGRT